MTPQAPLPCTDEELLDAIASQREARFVLEGAQAAFDRATCRVRDCLHSLGVLPSELT